MQHDTDDCWRNAQNNALNGGGIGKTNGVANGTNGVINGNGVVNGSNGLVNGSNGVMNGGDVNNNKECRENRPTQPPPPPPTLPSSPPPPEVNVKQEVRDDTNIIPWRAQLRKTNSKLSLLD